MLVIVICVLSMLLVLVSIESIWRCIGSLINSLTQIASVAESSLGTADTALKVVDPVLFLLPPGMRDKQNHTEQLSADLENGDPLVDTLSMLIGKVIKPWIPQIITTISSLLTFQLVWSLLAHVELIFLAWFYLKFGRMDFLRLISD